MIQRMVGTARLKAAAYEDVEADKSATRQAVIVVLLGAIATGVAFFNPSIQTFVNPNTTPISLGILHLVSFIFAAVIGWALLALIAYLIGTKLLPSTDTSADWGELARTLGFAQSPRVLLVFSLLPGIGVPVFVAVHIWILVAQVVAIRQALDYTSTLRAVVVTILSFIPYYIIMGLLV
jgi:hypothetical protein